MRALRLWGRGRAAVAKNATAGPLEFARGRLVRAPAPTWAVVPHVVRGRPCVVVTGRRWLAGI